LPIGTGDANGAADDAVRRAGAALSHAVAAVAQALDSAPPRSTLPHRAGVPFLLGIPRNSY